MGGGLTESIMVVSIVIPTYYRNDLLQGAVKCAAEQTYEEIEIVVVDDSGQEHAKEIVEELTYADVVYVAHEENKGAATARDSGVNAATGDYIHFLDDDDRLKRKAVENKLQVIQQSEGVGVVYGGLEWEDHHVVTPQKEISGDVLESMLTFDVAPCLIGTMLVEKELLDEISPMADLPSDDGAVRIELARRTQFAFAENALLERYNTEDSMGESVGSAKERMETIEYYEPLYDQYRPELKRQALARTYLLLGSTRLNHSLWSSHSILDIARANYWYPGMNVTFLCALMASLLGRPGWDFGLNLYTSYILGDSHEGTLG